MTEVDVIIEIAKGDHIKYKYDTDKNILICDRIHHKSINYPFNIGFIPNTLSENNESLNVVVLMDYELVPGCIIKCKILGYLDTKDEAGNCPKLIVCPVEKVDPNWKDIDDLISIQSLNLEYNLNQEELKYINDIEYINGIEYINDCENYEVSCLNINPLIHVKYFFEHYKDLENKVVQVGNFYNKEEALKIYKESIDRFTYKSVQKIKINYFFENS